MTDEGHHILDCAIRPESDLRELAAAIKAMTGVVEHGLFLEHADVVLLGAPDGSLRATGQVVNCTGCRPSMCGPISSLTTRRCSG